MIFSTLKQFNCFLIFIFFGIICCLIYNIFSIIFLKNFQKKSKNIAFDTFFYGFFNIFLVFLINLFNFGKFSFALIFAFYIGFLLNKFMFNKLVVFFENKWYNLLTRLFPKGEKHNASKSKKS